MNLQIVLAIGFLVFSGCLTIQGQSSWLTTYSDKEYWIKNSLTFWQYGDTKILVNDIHFPGDGRPVNRGQKVAVRTIEDEGAFARVNFSYDGDSYTLLVLNSDRRTFKKAFELAFSKRPIKEYWSQYYCEEKMKTKKDVIRCYGYPLGTTKTIEGNKTVETLNYSCWFLGKCISWDLIEIKIVNGRIKDYRFTI